MATLSHVESRRLYSWWWDSHISPKNSKWLQENLTDMDSKVKSMIKIINEDADSFARRAEMYYRKRPELMKLVEEFYRAYRALAERYDHATGALRQAQRTITEVFPNQIPFVLDELPSGFSSSDADPHTPDMPPPLNFFDSDGSQKDASSLSSFPGFKRNGAFSDDDDSLSSKKGLKQLHDMFGSGEGASAPRFAESKVRKGLNFQEEGDDDAFEKAKVLQEKLSQLSTENEDLKRQAAQEAEDKLKTNHDLQRLQEACVALESEKEEALSQFRQSLERIIELEAEIEKFKELNANLLLKVSNLDDSEEKRLLLERENGILHLEVDTLRQKTKEQQEELILKQAELDKLKLSVQDEHLRCVHAEAALETLESLYSHCQEELRTSSLEIQDGLQKLKDMESSKEALEESMEHVKEENSNLNKELKLKIEELEKLKIAIQDECQRSVQAESALLSLKKLHAQSQDEVKELACEIQGKTNQLKDLEARKQFLELEIDKVREDICTLNEQNFSLQSLINNLQDQIMNLKETQTNLENEVALHKDENKVLHGELFILKDEINHLKQRHKQIAVQLEEVGLNEDSLQTSIKDLQDGNIELKEICKKQENEKALLLEKLDRLEKISEKNALLENSLSDANSELEDLRAKIKALEESCEILHEKNSVLISEKSMLASNIEMITQNMEKLLESKVFLENSLSDANVEIEGLRGRLKSLEESCQALHNDKLNLQSEKDMLLSQVERIEQSLSDLQKKYVKLHENHSYLEREKESTHSQISELKDLLKLEKQANIAFMNSNNSRLALLEEQISLLREDGRCREEEFKNEQLNLLAAQIEISILHRCLDDLKENNFCLSKECHKMEQHILEQRGKERTLLDQIERLRRGTQMILETLHANENNKFSNCSEELSFQIILDKIKEMLSSIHRAEDKKHALEFENSIYITLLHNLGLDSANLKLEKQHLYEDCRTKSKEILLLEAENSDLSHNIEELKRVLEEDHRRLEILVTQKEDLGKQLSDMKEEQHIKSNENHKLHEQNQLLSAKLVKLTEEMHKLEEAHSSIIERTVTLDCLCLAFKHLSNERAIILKTLNNDLNQSHEIKCDLQRSVEDMTEKIEALELENFQLKELALKVEECRAHLGIISIDLTMARDLNKELNSHVELLDQRIKIGENLLTQKNNEFLEAELKFQDLQNQNSELSYKLENKMTELDESKALVVELEKQVVTLLKDVSVRDKEISTASQVKEILDKQLHELHKQNDNLKNKEAMLTSAISNDMKSCESEVSTLHHELQLATVHASIFEDKLLEAVGKCDSLEICSLVERSILHSEITAKTEHIQNLNTEIDILQARNKDLNSELDGYLPILSCLDNSISSMEKYILPLRDCSSPTCHEMKDYFTEDLTSGGQNQRYDQRGKAPGGVLELQKLLTKVEALREVLESSNGQFLHSNSDAKSKNGKERKNKEGKQFLGSTAPGKGFDFQIYDGERTTDKDDLMMKDIQLDHVSNSSRYDFSDDTYGMSALDDSETNDQMLELWETAENHSNNKKGKAPFISGGHGLEFHNIEAVEEEKSEYPSSELIAEKELGIDKLEIQKTGRGSHQDWRKNVAERLSSDAQRLGALQTSIEELKQKMERTEELNHPKSFEYDTVKMQLQDAEESILKLANSNKKLMKDTEACSRSPANSEDPEGAAYQRKRQVSKRARRGSEKIGRLELELQKLQYILLKLEEEFENMRSKAAERKSRVILRDYLYGRRDKDGKRKKGRLCGCMRPRTKGD